MLAIFTSMITVNPLAVGFMISNNTIIQGMQWL